jgi:hypothetical protein
MPTLERVEEAQSALPSVSLQHRRPSLRAHVLAVAVFALIAVSFQVQRTGWRGAADAVEGDLGNVAAFAAGHGHPELFAADDVLGDARNFGWYATMHVPLARYAAPLMGGYARVLLATYGAHIFAHLMGFYLLGLVLFNSSLWSLVLAFVALAPVSAGIVYDGWGLFDDPLPRLTYSAITGFLLAGAVKWRTTPMAWPWLMLAAGATTYVHPVSAPAIGLALWLGLWSHHPAKWSWAGRLVRMAGLGLLFILPAVPFALAYVTGRQYAPSGSDPLMQEIYRYRFLPHTMNVPFAMKLTLKALLFSGTAALGMVGAIVLLRAGKWREGTLRQFALWLAAIALVGAAMPLTDYFIATSRGAVTAQVDLERNVRFFVPVLLVLFVWAMAELDRRTPRSTWARLGLLVATAWFAAHGGVGILARPLAAAKVLATGKPSDPQASRRAEAIAALRELTPPGTRVLPWNFPPSPIRHAALRPVVHAAQDGSSLLFSRRELAAAWYGRQKRCDELARQPAGPERLGRIISLARTLEADCLLIDEPLAPGDPLPGEAKCLWSNQTYSLLRLSETQPD